MMRVHASTRALAMMGTMVLTALLTAGCDGAWWPETGSGQAGVAGDGGSTTGATSATTTSGGGSDSAGDANDESALVSCDMDSRVAHLADGGVSVRGALGKVTATIIDAEPSPPGLQTNSWTLRFTDSTGAPIVGAAIVGTARMPDHGHKSPILPRVTANPDGTYTATPLYFFMPGVWLVSFDVRPGGQDGSAALDTVVILFCING